MHKKLKFNAYAYINANGWEKVHNCVDSMQDGRLRTSGEDLPASLEYGPPPVELLCECNFITLECVRRAQIADLRRGSTHWVRHLSNVCLNCWDWLLALEQQSQQQKSVGCPTAAHHSTALSFRLLATPYLFNSQDFRCFAVSLACCRIGSQSGRMCLCLFSIFDMLIFPNVCALNFGKSLKIQQNHFRPFTPLSHTQAMLSLPSLLPLPGWDWLVVSLPLAIRHFARH